MFLVKEIGFIYCKMYSFKLFLLFLFPRYKNSAEVKHALTKNGKIISQGVMVGVVPGIVPPRSSKYANNLTQPSSLMHQIQHRDSYPQQSYSTLTNSSRLVPTNIYTPSS